METQTVITGSTLDAWKLIGSGGFGKVYKVKHVEWRMNVAVKLLHLQDSSALLREAQLMRQGSNPHVLRILGVYESSGCEPLSMVAVSGWGLVMEFMERGSLAHLLETLSKPPPVPLASRLAHQIALGMNFLHCLSPPLLHLDLKPSNVLLDDSLNAKLTDFGLAKLFNSLSTASSNSEEGGTVSYMPPEAFNLHYKPTPASDVYSYAIVLWSIITAEEPYPDARTIVVRLRIPEGDRPNLETVDPSKAEDFKDIISLMKRCWNNKYQERPSFRDCLQVTEQMIEVHKCGVNDAVHEVLKFLDSKETQMSKHFKSLNISGSTKQNNGDFLKASTISDTERSPPALTQRRAGDSTSKSKTFHPARVLPVDPHMASYRQTPPADQAGQSFTGPLKKNVFTPAIAPPRSQEVSITMSNVKGLQIGNNNKMVIIHPTRSRHHTAPSTISLPTPKTGRAERDGSTPAT
ncbi:receptor-interacting serine/threonine-protein kinase 4-like [Arapaima gigas]